MRSQALIPISYREFLTISLKRDRLLKIHCRPQPSHNVHVCMRVYTAGYLLIAVRYRNGNKNYAVSDEHPAFQRARPRVNQFVSAEFYRFPAKTQEYLSKLSFIHARRVISRRWIVSNGRFFFGAR